MFLKAADPSEKVEFLLIYPSFATATEIMTLIQRKYPF
jgi:hypothetical protein